MEKMTAVVYDRYGPPEVLRVTTLPRPNPRKGEIQIKIHTTSVTVADTRARAFRVPRSFWLPARMMLGITGPRKPTLGMELAGVVTAVGTEVQNFKVGDRVLAATLQQFGGYAEYICLPETGPIVPIPPEVSDEVATALPIGTRTAWHYLKKGQVEAGQHVLVYGASGSVGTYTVQLAKHLGARVTGVCSEKNRDLVLSLGADEVLDYTAPNFQKQLGQYDVFFDAVHKYPFSLARKALTPNGTYLDVATPIPSLQMLWTQLSSQQKIVVGHNPPQSAAILQFLMDLVKQGVLSAVIDRTYPLTDIVAAHRYVDQGHKVGNVIVRVGG